jgi:hypothetical protein
MYINLNFTSLFFFSKHTLPSVIQTQPFPYTSIIIQYVCYRQNENYFRWILQLPQLECPGGMHWYTSEIITCIKYLDNVHCISAKVFSLKCCVVLRRCDVVVKTVVFRPSRFVSMFLLSWKCIRWSEPKQGYTGLR